MHLVGFDIETDGDEDLYGLQPYRVAQNEARITSVAAVDEAGTVLFSELNPTKIAIRDFLKSVTKDTYLIGWNTQFDVSWLIAYGLEDEVRACKWLDGEVLRRAWENDTTDKSYGLKPTVAKYLPAYAGYEKALGGNFEKVDGTLLKYNILDAGLTAKVGGIFLRLLANERRLPLSVLICKAIVPVAKAWVEGVRIDTEAVGAWEADAMRRRDEHFTEFMSLSGITADEADTAKKMLTSPVKLKKYLIRKGFPIAKTDRTELSKFSHDPLVRSISAWKQENTSVTRFIKSITSSLRYTGTDRTYPSCRLWNTYTGRFGYTSTTGRAKTQTGIAIHQFPRRQEARNCIIAPDGMLLVELDFATQESRLICDFSGDPTMQDIFDSGKDFHTFMAAIIENVDYEDMLDRIEQKDPKAKESRQLAKIINLSCQYRTGWKKLIDIGRTQYDVIFDDVKARYLHSLYRDTYKRVPEYWSTAIATAKAQGYAETRGGRRVALASWAEAWAAESTAINFPIQGTGADQKFLAIAMIDDMLVRAGGRYMLDLHDAVFALVPDTSTGYDAAAAMQRTLSNLPYEEVFGWKPLVAMPVDLKIGKSWGALK